MSQSYSYNNANRLTEDTSYYYQYDANGNMTGKTNKTNGNIETFTYNSENQLTKYEVIVGTNLFVQAEYKYDGLGRRIEKNVDGVVTRYIYDNEDIILELNGSNNIQAQYTHGSGIDEPLMMKRNIGGVWKDYYYHADGLGSIVSITDESGGVIEKYVYDSFEW